MTRIQRNDKTMADEMKIFDFPLNGEIKIIENKAKKLDIPPNIPLCKAKKKSNNKWVTGFFNIETLVASPVSYLAPCIRGLTTEIFGGTWYEVDIETVCPVTHLKDIEQNNIFLNDILHRKYSTKYYVVIYKDGSYKLAPLQDKEQKNIEENVLIDLCEKEIENNEYVVCGNILD